MCLRKQFRPQNILNFMMIVTPMIHHKIHEKSKEKREWDLTHSFNDVGWMMSFGTSPPQHFIAMNTKICFNVLCIYYLSITFASLWNCRIMYILITELNTYRIFVCLRAASKLYIIIAFDMFLTEINSEEDGVLLVCVLYM